MTYITNDYDNFFGLNFTINCADNENNIDLIMPTLLPSVRCGLSFLYLMSLMLYTLIKPLFSNK